MALLHNTVIQSAMLGRRMAGLEPQLPLTGLVRMEKRCWYAGGHTPDRKTGAIDGARPPSTWMMGLYGGAMASRNIISGSGAQTSAITGGVNGDAVLTGAGDITAATAQLVISMVATLAGDGTVASADLRGYLNAVAELSGSGSVTAAVAALAWADAALSGSGTISSATPYATGTLSADIRGYSDLTPEGIRDKVWTYIIEAGFTAEQVVRLLAAHAAGDGANLEGAAPSFKSLDGSKTRIAGTYSAGTRTITSRDGD